MRKTKTESHVATQIIDYNWSFTYVCLARKVILFHTRAFCFPPAYNIQTNEGDFLLKSCLFRIYVWTDWFTALQTNPDKIALAFLYRKLVSKHGVILPNTSYSMKLLRYIVIKANFNDAVSIILRQVDDKDFYDGERNECDLWVWHNILMCSRWSSGQNDVFVILDRRSLLTILFLCLFN